MRYGSVFLQVGTISISGGLHPGRSRPYEMSVCYRKNMNSNTILLEETKEEADDCEPSKVFSESSAGHDNPPDKDERP